MAFTLKIAGVDRTSLLQKGTLRITNQIGSKADRASFFIENSAGTAEPLSGQEVIIEEDAVRVFGGIVAKPERRRLAPLIDGFMVVAQDFSKLLEKRLVLAAFVDQKAGDIIKNIVTTFVKDASITTTAVQDGPTIAFIAFNFKDARKSIDEIARLVGFDWYVDENKDIHFFTKTTNPSPFPITDLENRYRKFKIKSDSSQLKNRVIVRGGTFESSQFEEIYKGDTERGTFPISYRPTATPVVVAGAGGSPPTKTVGIKNQDDGQGFDFLYDENNQVIENDSEPILLGSEVIKIQYTFKIPVLVQVEDAASISEVAAIEGSDGVYEAIIVDESINNLDAARDRAKAEIARFSRPLFTGSFETFISGWRAGQLITINLASRGVSLALIVISVTLKSLGNGVAFYDVKFGSLSFALEDFLLNLFESGRKIIVREGEILDELNTVFEQLPIGDVVTQTFFKTPPFSWGAGGPNDTFWGQGEWA